MTKEELRTIEITKPSREIYNRAKAKWDALSKPLDGFGDFESLICQIAAIQEREIPCVEKRQLLVFCADNGIVEEGISQSSKEITLRVAESLGANISSACCLGRSVHTEVVPVDVGISSSSEVPGVLDYKVAMGTKNFLKEPAMSEDEVLKAIAVGILCVKKAKESGTQLIATGEMGIGNTTTEAAVLSALLKLDAEAVVGRGAGLNDEGLLRKKFVVTQGIEKYKLEFEKKMDEKDRAFEILRCLGGLDIAAMCGAFIGGAIYHMPIIIDGAISAVAALLAEIFAPGSKDYMIASHSGRELGTRFSLRELGKTPYILGNMALGEGTGALMLMPLIDSMLHFYKRGLRFENAGITQYERFNK